MSCDGNQKDIPRLRRPTIVLGLGSRRVSLAGVLKAMEKVNKHGGV